MQFLAPSRTPCRAVRTSMRRGVLFDDRIADAAKISPQSPSKESQEPCTLDLHNAKQWNCSGDPCFFSVHVWAGDQVRVIMMDSNVANLGQARLADKWRAGGPARLKGRPREHFAYLAPLNFHYVPSTCDCFPLLPGCETWHFPSVPQVATTWTRRTAAA